MTTILPWLSKIKSNFMTHIIWLIIKKSNKKISFVTHLEVESINQTVNGSKTGLPEPPVSAPEPISTYSYVRGIISDMGNLIYGDL